MRLRFDNVLSFLTEADHAQAKDIPSGKYTALANFIMKKAQIKESVWCVKHGRECQVTGAHIHIAGVPCIDHSSWGKREGHKGSTNIVYCTWAATRAKMLEPIVVLENVEQFGMTMTESLLGFLYTWERVLLNPLQLGSKTSRKRQLLIGTLKEKQQSLLILQVSPQWLIQQLITRAHCVHQAFWVSKPARSW